jgi:transcriptional regulator with XRE-family HTH domain
MTEQGARDFLAALGAEIKSWRQRRGMTRQQLAELVDISDTTIGRIERGSADASLPASDAWRIAAVLGLSFTSLVSRAEQAVALANREIPDAAERLAQANAELAKRFEAAGEPLADVTEFPMPKRPIPSPAEAAADKRNAARKPDIQK